MRTCRDRGGDVFITGVQEPVLELMESTGFCHYLGADRIGSEVTAIDHLFHKVLDPAICIYECPVRVFKECQNLPKQQFTGVMPLYTEIPTGPHDALQSMDSTEVTLIHTLHAQQKKPLIGI